MTWSELLSTVEAQTRLMEPQVPACESDGLISAVYEEAARPGMAEMVDASVRVFAREQRWPDMTPVECLVLTQRLAFAARVLRPQVEQAAADSAISAEIPFPEEEVWEWLLIDSWRRAVGKSIGRVRQLLENAALT